MNPLTNPNLAQDLMFGAQVPSMAAPAMNAQTMPSNIQVPQDVLKGAYTSINGPIGGKGWLGKIGGLENLGSILQGIGSLGQTYAAIKGLGIAKDQLNLSKEAYQTNLNNQRQTYNTSLEDRIRSRYHTEGRSGDVDGYLAKHSL